jgi:hypothetical protein
MEPDMYGYLTTPSEIATALRTIAARLDAMPDIPFPTLSVGFDVQICDWSTTDQAARIAAVDAFAHGLLGIAADTVQTVGGGWMHWTPCEADRQIGGVNVSVFGNHVPAPADTELNPAA